MRKVVFYLGSMLLLGIYIVILIKSSNSVTASDEYNMFYIDKTLKYYCNDGELKSYSVNIPFVYSLDGNYKNQGVGWSWSEKDGIWTEGDVSTFYVYIDEVNKNYQLEIFINSSVGYNNYLEVNNVEIERIIFDDNVAILNIPSEQLRLGLNEFSIRTKDNVLPVNELENINDARCLNLFVNQIQLVEKVRNEE